PEKKTADSVEWPPAAVQVAELSKPYVEMRKNVGRYAGAPFAICDIPAKLLRDVGQQGIDRRRRALRDQLHRTVRQILHVTCYRMVCCNPADGVTESHSLDATAVQDLFGRRI